MNIDELLIIKAFIKLTFVGVLIIFSIGFTSSYLSDKSYKNIAFAITSLSLIVFLSSWMIGVGVLTYPSHHFENLCKESGHREYKIIPDVSSILLERNTGRYPHRDGFNPWSFVADSKLSFLEQELGGKGSGMYKIYKESSSINTEDAASSVSDVILEINTISSKAELNANIYGERMSFYKKSTKDIYSTFTYFWNSRGSLKACPANYYQKYSGINTTRWAVEIVGANK